jgi:hypothetical protein
MLLEAFKYSIYNSIKPNYTSNILAGEDSAYSTMSLPQSPQPQQAIVNNIMAINQNAVITTTTSCMVNVVPLSSKAKWHRDFS